MERNRLIFKGERPVFTLQSSWLRSRARSFRVRSRNIVSKIRGKTDQELAELWVLADKLLIPSLQNDYEGSW
jgi:hypothetical protein